MGKKRIIGVLIIFALPVVIAGIRTFFKKPTQPTLTIGILQTASHPALDAVCNGFMQEAEHLFNGQVTFVIRNAQGSIDAMQTIAQQFHHNGAIDGVFAIATPALQTMAHIEKRKPIFFAAVTDPAALNILEPETNITGITDMINPETSIATIKTVLPQVKTLGIVFSASETNSLILVKEFEKYSKEQGIKTRRIALSSEADVASAITHTASSIDALIAPTDNMVANTAPLIGKLAEKQKLPFIVSDNLLIAYAFMSNGIDYAESGKNVAQQAYQVFGQKKHPYEVAITAPEETTPLLNKTVAQTLGITIPQDVACTCTIVEQGENNA